MSGSYNELPPLVFPFHTGPSLDDFTSSLLFSGELLASMPGWITSDPIEAFYRVGDRAHDLGHPLLPLFGAVNQYFDQAQEQGLSKLEELKPLEKIRHTLTVYPATEEHYSEWESLHDPCLRIALGALGDPQIRSVAALDFIFRIYEHTLESDDPDRTLDVLAKRADHLGSLDLLLAECALNRFTMARPTEANLVTNSLATVSILAHIGKPREDTITEELRAEELSFFLFDNLIASYVPPLRGGYIERIASLMDERAEELNNMRNKCHREAWNLVDNSLSEPKARAAIRFALETMEEEVSAIGNLTQTSFKGLVQDLLEDRVFWTTSIGFIGSVLAPLPPAAVASVALTALPTIAAKSAKANRVHRESLKSSSWSFVYYLTRKPSRPISLHKL